MTFFSPGEYRDKRQQLIELLDWAEPFIADSTVGKQKAFAEWQLCIAEGRDPSDLPPPPPDVVAWGVMLEGIECLEGLREMRSAAGTLWRPKQQEGSNGH